MTNLDFIDSVMCSFYSLLSRVVLVFLQYCESLHVCFIVFAAYVRKK